MAENDRNLGYAPQRSVRAALAAGVPIAMGTDASVPFVRHGDNAMELVLMVEAGLSPMQSKWLQPAMRPILLLAFTRI